MNRRIVLLLVATAIAGVGTVLVLLYVQGLGDKALAEQNPVRVLTASHLISPGETAAQAQAGGKFALTEMPASAVLDGGLTSIDPIAEQLALTAIYPGEQILSAKFGATAASEQTLGIPKGKLAISVQLDDPARVAGFVTPGSHVAIFVSADPATLGSATGGTARFTRILLADVEVIGVGQTTVLSTTTTATTGEQTTEEIPKTILTLALDQRSADRVIFCSKNGELSFGLLTDGTKVTPDRGVTASDLFQ